MNKIKELFLKSKFLSIKHSKYFDIYNELLNKYKNKKIIFVEIGIANGGSLFFWKKFFLRAKIIGIDLNPECKKFEKYGFKIEIGDQASPIFWKKFFNKYGKIDVILDDGGHTNYQQISTVVNCIPFINNDGILITEDTFSSYMKDFGNPSKYSFINFAKKTIDDINYNYPGLGQFKYSLNKFIYSISCFDGIVAFKVNRKLCLKNCLIKNNKPTFNHKDFRYNFEVKNKFKNKILRKLNYIYIILKVLLFNKIISLKTKKYFK
jgi:hypothetical protein